MNPDYNIFVAIDTPHGATVWHKIGAGWKKDNGITVDLNSLPLPGRDGKCRMHLFKNDPNYFKDKEKKDDPIEDDLPF